MIKVIKSGFYTTVQDKGRYHYRHLGVPTGGVMDRFALDIANKMVQNIPDAAVLEITMTGPKLHFNTSARIAITGAYMSPYLNDIPLFNYEPYEVHPGDHLSFGKLIKGFRTYLAVSGGIETQTVLGSRSFAKNITGQLVLKAGDELPLGTRQSIHGLKTVIDDSYLDSEILTVFPGPEFHKLPDEQKRTLFNMRFTVAKENNRMAYQLTEVLPPNTFSMITSATLPGTVQLTPSGKLIILMRDGQTTGGYPRILQLSEASVSKLAQKKTGDRLKLQQ
ncbi:biotin-dependent carboxyltransferase family protein [Ascidiimonas aurantiaca]|uniref:5-oxoprolinase subunit C family protein n=1 Tax=Ascidiimonas aurantiaca TaxID=1685432 RepID=UPI0030EE9C77